MRSPARYKRALPGYSQSRSSCAPQRKPIVIRFPQTQAHQLLIHTIINFRPKRAHDVLAGRRCAAKIFRFQIQMTILPRFQRFMNRVIQRNEIIKRSSTLVIFAANRCLCQIRVAVARGVVAFTVQSHVIGVRKSARMQSMCRVERYL